MKEDLMRIVLIHGSIRATPAGPSYNHNNHNINSLLRQVIDDVMSKNRERIDLIVLHAYASTGNIPSYIKPPERAREKIRMRSLMLNPNALSSNNPVSIARRYATRHNVNILVGPLYEVAGPRTYVTTVLVTLDGELHKYRKMCLTSLDQQVRLSRGRVPGVFELPRPNGESAGKIGVFIDEDLSCPSIFKYMEMEGVDAVIGHMLPYESDYFHSPREEGGVVTMRHCMVDKVLTTRAMDTGAPIILVGGVLNVYQGGRGLIMRMWTPSTVLDPEDPEADICLTEESRKNSHRPFLTVDDMDTYKRVYINRSQAPRLAGVSTQVFCDPRMQRLMRSHCTGKAR